MGRLAQQHADHVVLTSDNPRSENPMSIIEAIRAGLDGTDRLTVEPDRGRAIAYALIHAGVDDVVLVAGKGHEDYQETAGVRQPFSDKDCALGILRRIGVSPAGLAGGTA